MEDVSGLKNLQHRSVFMFDCLGTIHRLVKVRIKLSPGRVDSFGAELQNIFKQLLVDKFKPRR